jgi:hypothetical protein
MSKLVKLSIVLGSAVLLLVAAAGVGLYFFFPAAKIRAEAEKRGSQALGMRVSVGAVRPGLIPLGIRIDSIRLGEAPAPGKPSVRVAQLRVGVKVLPLLRRELRISEIAIEKPEIVMVESPAAAAEPPKRPAPAAPAAKSDLNLFLERLAIRDGSFTMLSPKGKPTVEIAGISETLSASAQGAQVFALEGVLEVGRIRVALPAGDLGRGLTLRLEKKLTYRMAEDRLSIERGALRFGDLPVSVSGTAEGLRAPQKSVDLALKGGPANIRTILAYIPAGMIPDMNGVSSEGVLSLDGHVKGPIGGASPPDGRMRLVLKDGRVTHPEFSAPVEGIQIDLEASQKALRLTTFRARVGKSRIEVTGTVAEPMKAPVIDLAVQASADLADVVALQGGKGRKASGTVTLNVKGKGPVKRPETVDWSGDVALAAVAFEDAAAGFPPLKDASGRLSVNRQSAQLTAARGSIGSSDFVVNGRLDRLYALYSKEHENEVLGFNVALTSRNFDLDELGLGKGEKPAKKDDAPPDLTILKKLEGEAKVSAGKAKFNGIDMADVRGVATLKDAVFTLQTFTLKSFGGGLKLGGTMDYRNPKTPKFDLDLAIDKVKAPKLLGYATNLNRFGKIGEYLTGDLSVHAKFAGELNESMGLEIGKLTSVGDLKLVGGALAGYPLQNSIASALNVPSLKSVALQDWIQPFRIQGGKLDIRGLKLKAKDFSLTANGTQSADGNLDLGMDLDLPASMAQGIRSKVPSHLGDALFGDGGRVTVPLSLGGSLAAPQVGVDSGKLAAAAQDRMKSKVAKQGGEQLDRLLGNPAGTKKAPAKTAPSRDSVKDTLKKLF